MLCKENHSSLDDNALTQAISTLDELDWCLEQLETMQTHKSVSDLASLKVKHRYARENSHSNSLTFVCSLSVCSIKNYHILLRITKPAHKLAIIFTQLIQVND